MKRVKRTRQKKGNLWVLLKLFLCYCFELENRGRGAYAVCPNDIWVYNVSEVSSRDLCFPRYKFNRVS